MITTQLDLGTISFFFLIVLAFFIALFHSSFSLCFSPSRSFLLSHNESGCCAKRTQQGERGTPTSDTNTTTNANMNSTVKAGTERGERSEASEALHL